MIWAKQRISDVVERVQYGYTESASITPIGPKFLRITDIVSPPIDWASVPYCKVSDQDFKKYQLNIGDTVIARTGNTTGASAYIKDEVEAVFASYLIRLLPDVTKVDPRFLGYVISGPAFQGYVHAIRNNKTAQPGINAEDIKAFEFPCPALPVQQRIADILSAYDDLIENNLRRIQLLEEAARCRYKLMMEENSADMRSSTLGDELDLNYGKALKATERVPGAFPVYGSSGIVGTHEKYLIEGPGIIVGRKGNVGSVFWSFGNFFPIDTVYYVSSDISLYFLYHNLKYDQHFDNSDAAVPGLNRNHALSNKIRVPTKPTLIEFDTYCEGVFHLVHNLQQQNSKLREARDIFLPRLMSGEIDVTSVAVPQTKTEILETM